jgi:hypothetical protein
MTNELVPCPECDAVGWVWYDGTTPPTGDDPSMWVECPTCKGKFFVNNEWASRVEPHQEQCAICHRERVIAVVPLSEDDQAADFWEPVCYQCFYSLLEKLGWL